MRNTDKTVVLKLTAAIVVDGSIVRAGSLVEVMQDEAKDLLRRGKAVLAAEPAEQHDEGGETEDHQAAAAAAAEAAANAAQGAAKPAATRKGQGK